MRRFFLSFLVILFSMQLSAQEAAIWTESDRAFLLAHLNDSKEALIKEIKGLSDAQWDFREEPGRWSIREITEHIAFWELILQREISVGLNIGPLEDWKSMTQEDSVFIGFIYEEKKHLSNDYTWPFTFSQPLGKNTGDNNVAWFLKMRNEAIEYLKTAKEDLRKYFVASKSSNIHQRFITTYGHCDRHVRQIQKVKQHPRFPRG